MRKGPKGFSDAETGVTEEAWEEGIRLILDSAEKEEIAGTILNDLPEWFGLAESTREYIKSSREMPFIAYEINHRYAGFIVLKETGPYTAEIYVLGICKEYHRRGIGKKLYDAFVEYAKEKGYEYMQVKTVDEGFYDEYDRTRLFYEKMGFRKLECFPSLWDECNPCLIMIKAVK